MLFSQPTIDEGCWALVEKFIANLDGKLQDSSGNCHKLVASGEYALGVTIEKSAVPTTTTPTSAMSILRRTPPFPTVLLSSRVALMKRTQSCSSTSSPQR